MLAILCPMASEAAGIRRALAAAGADVRLDIAGIGRRNIAAAVARAAAGGAHAIIIAGFGGGLDPNRRTGDLHIASEFRIADAPDGRAIPADARLAARLRAGAPDASAGPSVTVAALAQPEWKAALWQAGAGVTVNMEDYWAADAAADAGIPFAAVRAVLDTAGQALPEYLAPDAAGGVRPARIAATLPMHPARAPELVRLARQSRLAQHRLADAVIGALGALTLAADRPAGAAQ